MVAAQEVHVHQRLIGARAAGLELDRAARGLQGTLERRLVPGARVEAAAMLLQHDLGERREAGREGRIGRGRALETIAHARVLADVIGAPVFVGIDQAAIARIAARRAHVQGALARMDDAVGLSQRDRDLADDRLFGGGIAVVAHALEDTGKGDAAVGDIGEADRDADQAGAARFHARRQSVVARLRVHARALAFLGRRRAADDRDLVEARQRVAHLAAQPIGLRGADVTRRLECADIDHRIGRRRARRRPGRARLGDRERASAGSAC